MRQILLILLLVSITFCKAQTSASANVQSSANIVEPIEITKNVDLHFGNIVGGFSQGSLVLNPDGTRSANGIELSTANPGEVSAAEAIITHGNYNYSIALPDNFRLFNQENPNQFLIIDTFTALPVPQGEGTDILKIGATLNVEANQSPGLYINSAGFSVTVTYN